MYDLEEIARELWEAESLYIHRPLFDWKNGGPVLVWNLMSDKEKGVYRRMASYVSALVKSAEKAAIIEATRQY